MFTHEWRGGLRPEGNTGDEGDEDKYRPAVAIGLDGVLRRLPLRTGAEPGALLRTIRLSRNHWPYAGRRAAAWEEWTSVQEFSRAGVEWVGSLLARGLGGIWATSWPGTGNAAFSNALGFGELPKALAGAAPDVWAPADQRRTLVYRVPDPIRGLSEDDARRLDDWVELMSSPAGHEEMRRQRRRELLERKRRPEGLDESWSCVQNVGIFRDLHRVIPDDPDVLHTLTDLALTWALRPEEIEALLQVRGYADERTLREVTEVLERHAIRGQGAHDAR